MHKREERGHVTAEALLVFLPVFFLVGLVALALWKGLGGQLRDYAGFLRARARLAQSQPATGISTRISNADTPPSRGFRGR